MADSICCYGATGTYKSTNAGRFAKWIYEKTGKKTRLISADGGGWKPMEHLIDIGIIIPWQISTIDNPLPVLRKLSKGYWPIIVEEKGERKLRVTPPNAKTWNEIGGYIVESFTSIGDALMRDNTSKQRKVAQDVVGAFSESIEVVDEKGNVTKDVEKFSAPAMAHYGLVQNQVGEMVAAFRSLPIEAVLFTALEAKGEEKMTRRTILGPAIIGSAATSKVPSWVGSCIHHQAVIDETTNAKNPKEKEQIRSVRLYFMPHSSDVPNLEWPAKPRGEAEEMAGMLKKFPGGFIESTPSEGLDVYLRALDEAQGTAVPKAKEWKKQVDEKRAKEEKR